MKKRNKISDEKSIINNFYKKKKRFQESEHILYEHFLKIIDDMLEKAKSISDLDMIIKENLNAMPDCESKICLLRKIYQKGDELSKYKPY